jgi:drug/metabolite transporter (DMT)-like permease
VVSSILWAPITIGASAAQVFRNGAQASLTERIGTLGATQVRFIFGFPFALLFLALAVAITGQAIPGLNAKAVGWAFLGALAQIAATALMLMVMRRRAFGVAYAYIKTEPVSVALLGLVVLGDRLGWAAWLAVAMVTVGVVLATVKPSDLGKLVGEAKPILVGTMGGVLFGISAIAFRGSILALESGDFIIRSLTMLVVALFMQSVMLGAWLALRDRAAFIGSLREWRTSLLAGALGAAASAGWFLAFSLTAAANVRTLALVEMPIAAAVTRRVSGKAMAANEWVGMALIMAGVALLLGSLAA